MRFGMLTGIALIGLLSWGCSSMPQAPISSGAKNAVVVDVAVKITNASVNIAKVELKLLNFDTKANFTAMGSLKDGLMYVADVPAGTYSIRELKVTGYDGINVVVEPKLPAQPYKPSGALFEVVEGKVNNLGVFAWTFDAKAGTSTYTQADFDKVKAKAKASTFAASSLEWVETKFSTEDADAPAM